jgi:ribonuclease E
MTRQRIRPSLKRSVYKECPACAGSGLVKSAESMHAIEVIRKLIMCAQHASVARIAVTVEEEVASYINNRKRRELTRMEDEHSVQVLVISREDLSPEFLKFDCEDASGP